MARTIDFPSLNGAGTGLSRMTLFASLEEEERRLLWNACRMRIFKPGEVLFHEEDPGQLLYLLQSGWVKIVAIAPDGAETLLQVHGPGGCLGELSLLDGEPRCATAIALDRVEALLLNRDDFLDLLDRSPRLVRAVIHRLTGMVRDVSSHVQDAAVLDIRARLAKRLLELARRHGEPTAGGTRLALRLTQQELGQMIGAARSHVNRHLCDFQERGILTVERDGIVIHRPEELWKQVEGPGWCRE